MSHYDSSQDTATVIWREACAYLGLDGFQADSILYFGADEIEIVLSKRVSARELARAVKPGDYIRTVIQPVIDRVQTSRAVEDAMAERDREIAQLKAQAEELQKQLAQLQDYRAYIEIEMKLRHGVEAKQ